MRILHTSDWHLNERLGGDSRQPDLDMRLKEIAIYLEQERIDVMLVAGDIFSDHYPRFNELREIMTTIKSIFEPFIKRGGTMIWIAGNHDNEDLFQFLQDSMTMASPARPNNEKVNPGGRLYICSKPAYLSLADPQGNVVQFALIPYPTRKRYLETAATHYKSKDELNRALYDAVTTQLARLKRITAQNSTQPSVLVAHGYLRDGEISHTNYKLTEQDDVIFELRDLPLNWSYVAYGHIHKPQTLYGAENVRYSGSLDRFDMGEASDQKSVVVLELDSHGRQSSIKTLPLNATPLYNLGQLTPDTNLAELADLYSERERAIASYELVYQPGKHNVDAFRQQLDQLFPRRYNCRIVPESILQKPLNALDTFNTEDVVGTLRQYIVERYEDEQQRKELSELLEQMLLEESK